MPESSVIPQEEGQAFWIYRGPAQQMQTAMVSITVEQVVRGWQEIRRQEEMHRQLLEVEYMRPDVQQVQRQANTATNEQEPTICTTDWHATKNTFIWCEKEER